MTVSGQKMHTQTLAAMMPEASSYEDLMDVCLKLQLPYAEVEETYRRAVFNILTTNVDAHIKNFSFMMRKGESWHGRPVPAPLSGKKRVVFQHTTPEVLCLARTSSNLKSKKTIRWQLTCHLIYYYR